MSSSIIFYLSLAFIFLSLVRSQPIVGAAVVLLQHPMCPLEPTLSNLSKEYLLQAACLLAIISLIIVDLTVGIKEEALVEEASVEVLQKKIEYIEYDSDIESEIEYDSDLEDNLGESFEDDLEDSHIAVKEDEVIKDTQQMQNVKYSQVATAIADEICYNQIAASNAETEKPLTADDVPWDAYIYAHRAQIFYLLNAGKLTLKVLNSFPKEAAEVEVEVEAKLEANSQEKLEANSQERLEADSQGKLEANSKKKLQENFQKKLEANSQVAFQEKLEANSKERLKDNSQMKLKENSQMKLEENSQDRLEANWREKLKDNFQENLQENFQDEFEANSQGNLEAELKENFAIKSIANHSFVPLLKEEVQVNFASSVANQHYSSTTAEPPDDESHEFSGLKPLHLDEFDLRKSSIDLRIQALNLQVKLKQVKKKKIVNPLRRTSRGYRQRHVNKGL